MSGAPDPVRAPVADTGTQCPRSGWAQGAPSALVGPHEAGQMW